MDVYYRSVVYCCLMTRMAHIFSTRPSASLLACSIRSGLVAAVATMGAGLGWGNLGFGSPTYHLILLLAAWCPASKLIFRLRARPSKRLCPWCAPGEAVRSADG